MITTESSKDHRKPRRKSGLLFSRHPVYMFAWVLVVAGVSWSVNGCGPTAPRFRVAESAPAASAERKTESRPDTVGAAKTDVESSSDDAAAVLSGKRSFKSEKNTSITNLDQAKMMREISKMMGVSYKLGGVDDDGIDCSAYTMNVYKNSMGKSIPRSSAEQYRVGEAVEYADLKFGDLVFFNTTGESASHVGIYLGDDLFAHASVSLGVTISSLESFYYKKRYEGARRIIP
jgi:cell wall-associated NlpC family hydrolase